MPFIIRFKNRALRLMKYEYWPYYIFYFPMYFYGLLLALKAGSFTYFTTANPGMKHGGIIGESKYKVLKLIPEKYIPKTLLIPGSIGADEVKNKFQEHGFEFPVIVKPDIGERGKMVEKIEGMDLLINYKCKCREDFLIQEYIDYPMEAGVLLYKYPTNDHGSISSIVTKGFLYVEGDGVSTLKMLIEKEIRAFSRHEYLFQKYAGRLNEVLKGRERFCLEPIGNHNRGTTFINSNHLINDSVQKLFNSISAEIKGYFYGRFDVKIMSESDLKTGKNLKILELNGVSSEPGHIYDPKYRLWNAYRDIANHMKIIYTISKINYKSGIARTPLSVFMKDLIHHFRT